MEDDLIAPVVEAEEAGLAKLEPELAKGYDEGLAATGSMASAVASVLTPVVVSRLWELARDRAATASEAHWLREARGAGILDRVTSPRMPAKALDDWMRENIKRYGLIRDRVKRETEARIRLERALGRRPETAARDLMDHGLPTYNGRMRGRALVIASDQLHWLAGMIAKHQQEDAGISRFVWRTQNDGRVRRSHRPLNGQRYRWDKPPSEGYPGEPIACRCYAEGVVE